MRKRKIFFGILGVIFLDALMIYMAIKEGKIISNTLPTLIILLSLATLGYILGISVLYELFTKIKKPKKDTS